jgi:non-specific serine/threonine protein kinase
VIRSTAGSTLWVARDRLAGEEVVVKVLHGPDASNRVEVEARALARLGRHPHLQGIRAVGIDASSSAWVVTSLAAGGSLAHLGATAPADLLPWMSQIAGALAHAHRCGVVHGDVTPSNVLLSRDGAGSAGRLGSALLADFGSATLDGLGATSTPEGTLVGCTPGFAPPERLRGGPPTPEGDVYCLARTAQAMLRDGRLDVLPRGPRRLLRRALNPDPTKRPTAAMLSRGLG